MGILRLPQALPTYDSRFWNLVNIKEIDDCWEWVGGKGQDGYGRARYFGKTWMAHRLVWAFVHGVIPPRLCVLHHCDNPPYCNPAHLFLGTHADNMADMYAKGRRHAARGDRSPSRLHPESYRGELCHRAKLKGSDIPVILQAHAAGEGITEIGHRYGVTRMTIRDIISGRTWKHIAR